MRIKKKLFLLLVLIGVIPNVIVSYSTYDISRSSWEYDKLNDLMNTVDAKYIHILDFLHMKKADVKSMGVDESIHLPLQDYYAGANADERIKHLNTVLTDIQRNSILDEHAQKKEKEAGTDLAKVFGRDVKWGIYRLDERIHRYDELLILDDNGVVLASSREESIGRDLSSDELFTRGKKEAFIKDVYEDYTGKVVFAFAAPIIEKHTKSHPLREKEFLGVIVLKIPIEYLNDITTGDVGNQVGGKLFFAGLGETLDFYIVRGDGMMITQPNSLIGKEDFILNKKVNTVAVDRCLIGGEAVPGTDKVVTKEGGNVREAQEISVNYEGVPVGVASMCIFEMNWTLIGEQNVDKIFAFKGVGTIRDLSLGIISIIILMSVFVAYYISEQVTRPVTKLKDAAHMIGEGNLDSKIEIKSNDEIEELAESFDTMRQDIRESRDNLEIKVKERTAELSKANTALKKEIKRRQRVEDNLAQKAQELGRSNTELEQFAYVTSHDLQEPLRMVTSYMELLAKRYKGQLDADADDFIEYAVDGASRMKTMIEDLLELSRVGTHGKEFKPLDCNKALDHVLANLEVAIKDAGAVVTHDPLPTVMADDTQLERLFQNLVGNAIKFHGNEPPRIHFSAEKKDGDWVFSVQDNGIGIEPEYADRVFGIFQRLHRKDEYPGTGIGLAVCKKIVERHGGRIWIESKPGKGSTFYFSITMSGAELREN